MFTSLLVASTVAMGAHHMPPPRPVDWLAIFTNAATRYWGNGHAPACGTPRFEWAPTVTGGPAEADPDSCAIRFAPVDWPRLKSNLRWLCVTVAHEVGHLFGHTHAEGGLMAGDTSVYEHWRDAPCGRLVSA